MRLLVCLLACGGGLACWSATAACAEGSLLPGQSGSPLTANPLIIPGGQILEEGQQALSVEEARRSSPEAVAEREASRTKFEGLDTEQAAKAAGEAFPGLVNRPEGGPPPLPAGQKLTGFAGANVAQVDLGGGKRGVIESTEPMAVETSSGHLTPIDLGLTEAGAVFQPSRPLVEVQLPKRLGDGAQLPQIGVSLTPVDEQGSPLAGAEGMVDGVSVFYANTQTDSDTVLKPTTAGLEAETLLRSVESPQQLYFRVGLPEGASLVQAESGSGAVEIMDEGAAIALIAPPGATDAAGTPVPVSMSVEGDLLALAVASHGGEYQWPIAVDPKVAEDKDLTGAVYPARGEEGTNWLPFGRIEEHFNFTQSYEGETKQSWIIKPNTNYVSGEEAGVQYQTQGESWIYKFEASTYSRNYNTGTVSMLELVSPEGHIEKEEGLSNNNNVNKPESTLCPGACEPEAPNSEEKKNNIARFRVITTTSGTTFLDELYRSDVYVSQEKAPTVEFNTTSPTIDGGRTNVMYGSGAWLSPSSGAFELRAKDPGIGISRATVNGGGFAHEFSFYKEDKCLGIQCDKEFNQPIVYNENMGNGAETFSLFAADVAELYGVKEGTVKVESTPPHNLEVSGWPKNREISAAPHTLTIEATDGEKPELSPGVKSISVSVDGGPESPVPGASCVESVECKAKGEWTLHAESLTEGVHKLVVSATDNAGNVAQEEFTFDVRHGSPVAVGPGTVDPTSGQFKLGATDVSLGGASDVSRVYESRDLTAGAAGPLGPQWTIGAGSGEGLTVLPTGNVVLAGSAGGVTTFTRNSKGEFESPLGDENLKVEAKEEKAGKGISEYLLKDSKAGATTTFKQPLGTEDTVPVYTDEFGAEGAQLSYPVTEAVDSSGNVWTTDYTNNRIAKFSPTGTLLAAYDSYGSEDGQVIHPAGIAINRSTGNVYVTDQGNSRIVELNSSGAFVEAIGWGVKDGKAESEVCKISCQAGIAGSGNGQFGFLAGMTVDSSGNLWVIDYGNNRIEEFNEKGEYLEKFGSEGTGNGQLKDPLDIASSGGNLYVSDYGNSRVEEFSTTGKYESQFGKSGTGSGEFKEPYGIATDPKTGNLYVVDAGNKRVQEFSAGGAFITKFGSSGTGGGQFGAPTGVVVNSTGSVYVADSANHRIQEWTRPTWVPTLAEGPLKSGTTAYAYKPVEEEGGTVIEPTEVLAPTPSGVSCVGESGELEIKALKNGCRALTFEYAEKTGATGEKETEWGMYAGHLAKVLLVAYNPATKKMEEPGVAVAEYAYDKQGRLRAEWDPRISPALKTTYGYDAEGHVTALTSPGQQPWAFTYGTIAGDANTGRLLKATQAHPKISWSEKEIKEKLSEQKELAKNTEAPKLSGTPVTGVTMGVSSGVWSNSPISYGYQWEDCNSKGEACTLIPGATNANYTVASSDGGHTLIAVVTATDGGGSVSVSTAASGMAGTPAAEYSLPSESSPTGIAAGPDGDLWFADLDSNKIGKITTSGAVTEYSLPSGSSPHGIVAGPDGNLWFTEYGNGKIGKITTSGAITEYSLPSGSEPIAITAGPDKNLWFTEYGTDKIGKITTSGTITEYGPLPSGSGPWVITAGPDGNLWFTDVDTDKIGKITTSGAITEYGPLPLESGPAGITAGPDGNLWFTDWGTSKIGKITTSGTVTEYSIAKASSPAYGIVAGPDGNLWFTMSNTSKIGKITTSGTVTEYSLPSGSDPLGIAVGSDGDLWFADGGKSKIGKMPYWGNGGITTEEGEHYSPGPGWTLEYHVPVSGAGAYAPNLSKEEVETWGQKKDDPTEGMAIFPPDEPQGWPASGYKRATIDYMDEQGRTVNMSSPTGGIATSEYNEANEMTRTLSADNRAAALKEGCKSVSKKECKSAEVSEQLDTKTEYNSEGNEIAKVIGPEHRVKLSTGSEVEARDVSHDYYDEGAKEVEEKTHETYNLVTKSTDGALLSSGEEKDTRETIDSYNGQEDLGWKLRKPTSVTTEPGGLNLTTTTVYNESTGNVVETRSIKGSVSGSPTPPVYMSQFGSAGKGEEQFMNIVGMATDAQGDVWVDDNGNDRVEELSANGGYLGAFGSKGTGDDQFNNPWGIAVNKSTGDVYVTDWENDRVEELSSSGAFMRAWGFGVSDGKAEFEICTSGCKAGTAGSGKGQFAGPLGIAVDGSGNVWVVDSGNNRVEEFSSEGAFIKSVGSKGTGKGQFEEPNAIGFSGNNFYVYSFAEYRVEEFSDAGAYIREFGSKGSGNGQFGGAYQIVSDPSSGDLYVTDTANHRVEEFTANGAFITKFGSEGSGNGQFKHPFGIAVNGAGTIYVGDNEDERIEEWEAAPAAPAYTSQFGAKGSENGQLKEPRGVAVAKNGNIYVLDTANSRVEEFSTSGAYLEKFGSSGKEKGELSSPYAMTVDSKGNVWIADTGNDRVDEFNEKREFVQAFGWGVSNGEEKLEVCTTTCKAGLAGAGAGQLKEPKGIGITATGDIYVGDGANNRVEEFNEKGEFLAAFGFGVSNEKDEYEICTSSCKAGVAGSGNGQFNSPRGVAVAPNGTVWIADDSNDRVEEFNEKDEYISKFGSAGSGNGQFKEPKGITVDSAGNVWVADGINDRVQEFTLRERSSRPWVIRGSPTGSSKNRGASRSQQVEAYIRRTSKTTASRNGHSPRGPATKARTTHGPPTTLRKKNQKSPRVENTQNGPTCPARPNRLHNLEPAYPQNCRSPPSPTTCGTRWKRPKKSSGPGPEPLPVRRPRLTTPPVAR